MIVTQTRTERQKERKEEQSPLYIYSVTNSQPLSPFLSQVMAFFVGSSCFLHSPLCQSRFPSSSASQPMFLYSCTRNAETNHSVHLKRRAILFVGITVLPLLQLKARAFEGLATSKTKISKLFGFQRFTYTAASFFFYGSM